MRKVIVTVEVSLDAVQQDPQNFIFDFYNDELMQYSKDLLKGAGALLMGRVTYEGFVEYWPNADSDEFSDKMNSLPKYVASRTLQEPLTWNATLLNDIPTEIAALKQESGGDFVQYGIGELTRTLMAHGLVDEFRILVYPVVVGSGERIFETLDKTALKLLEARPFSSGAVLLRYSPTTPSEAE